MYIHVYVVVYLSGLHKGNFKSDVHTYLIITQNFYMVTMVYMYVHTYVFKTFVSVI